MNLVFLYKYINLTLFALLGNFRPSSSAAIAPGILVSLYNSTDKVIVLDSQNFSPTVYNSSTAWLVEFYASWCGHCQSYAKTYKELGIETWAWKSVVRIGAINCYGGENTNLCRQYNVRGYPTLLLIPPDVDLQKRSKMINIPGTDAKSMQREIIKELDNFNRGNRTWPRFTPVNRLLLEEIYLQVPKSIKLLLMVVERHDDITGRQIMLDFSEYQDRITILRATTDGKLWRKFHLNLTDVPALFILHRNRTIERLDSPANRTDKTNYRNVFSNAIQSYINARKLLNTSVETAVQEIIQSRNALKNAQIEQESAKMNESLTDEIRDKNTIHQKVNMIDLELALSHMFRQEISQAEDIRGEAYDALVQWLTVLTKYFPGRPFVMNYLKYVSSKVDGHSTGLNGNEFREIIDKRTSNAYLPDTHQQYQHCAGSAPQHRGYPCALWLLFHTLTVSQYKTALPDSQVPSLMEIPMAIKNYVKHFFACRQCSENFMKETSDISGLDLKNKYQAILYLWKVHNHVNHRLRYEASEDPKHPKVQFPSQYLCTNCHLKENRTEFDQTLTIDFILEYYSKENIDTPLLTEKKGSSESVEPVISKIEYIDQPAFISRYSMYTCVVVFIVLILIRRRYCKGKRERYTL